MTGPVRTRMRYPGHKKRRIPESTAGLPDRFGIFLLSIWPSNVILRLERNRRTCSRLINTEITAGITSGTDQGVGKYREMLSAISRGKPPLGEMWILGNPPILKGTTLPNQEREMLRITVVIAMASQLVATAQTTDNFETRTQKGKSVNLTLPYRLFKPAGYTPSKKYPLVLALHGVGEQGTDNTVQLTAYQLATVWARDSNQAKFPAFVAAPQCPKGGSWSPMGRPIVGSQPSDPEKVAIEILDSLTKEFSLDTNRIYIAGLSLGGYGTWDLIMRYPDRFAAAVPICGWGDTAQAARIKTLPIWAFHGDADPTVPVAGSRNMIAAIKAKGGNPKYTEYPGVSHASWTPALKEPDLVSWVMSQRRGGTTGVIRSLSNSVSNIYYIIGERWQIDGRTLGSARRAPLKEDSRALH